MKIKQIRIDNKSAETESFSNIQHIGAQNPSRFSGQYTLEINGDSFLIPLQTEEEKSRLLKQTDILEFGDLNMSTMTVNPQTMGKYTIIDIAYEEE